MAGNLLLFTLFDDMAVADGRWSDGVTLGAFDAMKAAGTNFTRATCAVPVCNASRTSTFMGQYPIKPNGAGGTFVFGNMQSAFQATPDPVKLPANDIARTLPGVLHDAGWANEFFGKVFHNDGSTNSLASALFGAGYRSFTPAEMSDSGVTPDDLLGAYAGTQEKADHTVWQTMLLAEAELLAWDGSNDLAVWWGCYAPHRPYLVPAATLALFEEGGAYEITEANLDAVAPDDLPWYAQLAWSGTDGDYSTDERVRLHQYYLAYLHFADEMLARMRTAFATARTVAEGLSGKGLHILTSDHGYNLGDAHGLVGKGSLDPGATRVPLIAEGTNVAAAHEITRTVGLIDLYPTICGWFGVLPSVHGVSTDPLDRNGLDGRSLTGCFGGGTVAESDYAAWWMGSVCVLDGDGIWAITVTPSSRADGVPGTRRLTRFDTDPWGLGAPAASTAKEDEMVAKLADFGFRVSARDVAAIEAAGEAIYASDAAEVLFQDNEGTDVYFLRGDQVARFDMLPDEDDTDYVNIVGPVERDWYFPRGIDVIEFPQEARVAAGYTPRIRIAVDAAAHIFLPQGKTFVTTHVGNDVIETNNSDGAVISTGAGDDEVIGNRLGTSGITVDGGAGNDRITGSAGNDSLIGGAGADTVIGFGGTDRISLGAGADMLFINRPTGAVTVADWEAEDQLRVQGSMFGDVTDAQSVYDLAEQDGSDVLISLGSGAYTVRLLGMTKGSTFTLAQCVVY